MTMPAPSSMSRVVRIQGRRMSAISRGERRSSSEASEPASRKMSSDASSPRTSITSSTLMVPSSRRSLSVTGTATRSYLATSRATSSWSVSGDTLTTLGSRIAHIGVVRRHLVEDARDLELIERLHELQQRLVVELGEDFARALRGEQPEHGHLRLERQVAQERRDVGGMRGREQIDEPAAVAALEQRLDGLHAPGGLFHRAYRSHR